MTDPEIGEGASFDPTQDGIISKGELSSNGEVVKPFTVHVYEGPELTDEIVEKLKLRDLLALDLKDDFCCLFHFHNFDYCFF